MKIQVYIKKVYGNSLAYPVCKTAQAFSSLTGNKTLSRHELTIIKTMGYDIDVVADRQSISELA